MYTCAGASEISSGGDGVTEVRGGVMRHGAAGWWHLHVRHAYRRGAGRALRAGGRQLAQRPLDDARLAGRAAAVGRGVATASAKGVSLAGARLAVAHDAPGRTA